MKKIKRILSMLIVMVMVASVLYVNPVFAANFMDAGWEADFDSNFGGFPSNWAACYDDTLGDGHGKSLNMLAGVTATGDGMYYTNPSPFSEAKLDTASGIYKFSTEVYIDGNANGKFIAGPVKSESKTHLLDYDYNPAENVFKFYNEKGNATSISLTLEQKMWHQYDIIFDLENGTKTYYMDGTVLKTDGSADAYTSKIQEDIMSAIKSEGGYTIKNFYTLNDVGTTTGKYLLDNMSFKKVSKNSFSIAGQTPANMTSKEIKIDFVNTVDKSTLNKIKIEKFERNDVLMTNGTVVNTGLLCENGKSAVITLPEDFSDTHFYAVNMTGVKDITGNGFDEPVKTFFKSAEPEVKNGYFDYSLNYENENSLSDFGLVTKVALSGSDLGNDSTAVTISKDSTLGAIKFSSTTTPRGAWKKIKLDKATGTIKGSFDYIRTEEDGNDEARIYFGFADVTGKKRATVFTMQNNASLPVYRTDGFDGYNNGTALSGATALTQNSEVKIQFEVNVEEKFAKLVYGEGADAISKVYDFNNDINWTSDELYFCMDINNGASGTDFAIDNLNIKHEFKSEIGFENTNYETSKAGFLPINPHDAGNSSTTVMTIINNTIDGSGKMLLFDGSNNDRGAAKPVSIDEKAKSVTVAFDYFRRANDPAQKVVFGYIDKATKKKVQLFGMMGDEAPKYFPNGAYEFADGTVIPGAVSLAAGNKVNVKVKVDISAKKAYITYGSGAEAIEFPFDTNINWNSDSMNFYLHYRGTTGKFSIDNLYFEQEITGEVPGYIGGVTFFDSKNAAVLPDSEGKFSPSIKYVKFPVSDTEESNITAYISGVEGSGVLSADGVYTITLSDGLCANSSYEMNIGTFAENSGVYTINTGSGLFDLSNLKIVKAADNTEAAAIADCGSVKISVDAVNTEADKDVYLIVAGYKGSKMIKAYAQKSTIVLGINGVYVTPDAAVFDTASIDRICAYAWSSLSDLKPLCESFEIPNVQ